MEVCETLFLGLLQLGLLAPALPDRVPGACVALALLALPVHLAADGSRWQMMPAYAVATGLAIFCALGAHPELLLPGLELLPEASAAAESGLRATLLKAGLLLLGELGLLTSAVCAFLMPVPRLLPLPPDAAFRVGTLHLHLEDPERPEWAGRHETGRRQIMCQVFYPSLGEPLRLRDPGTGEDRRSRPFPSTYIRQLERFGPGLASQARLPGFVAGHLRHTKVHALRHTACARPEEAGQDRWPVLIFSHGYSGYGSQNYQLMEQLACRGYVVVGVDHAYDSCTTVLSNGDVRGFEARLPMTLPAEEIYGVRSGQLAIRVQDILFALDNLAAINEGRSPCSSELCGSRNTHWETLVGKLDTESVGLIGHSFGGATAVVAAAQDSRVQAVLGLDAWMFPLPKEVFKTGLGGGRPDFHLCLMEAPKFFQEDHPISSNNRAQAQQLLAATRARGARATHVLVNGSRHHAFCDLPILVSSTLFRLLRMDFGPLPNHEIQKIMAECSRGLFERSEAAKSPSFLAQLLKPLPACVITELQ